jgi:site-specific recombinase XerD
MTVYVRRNKRGWIEYHIKGRYPDGKPYEERRKSPLPTITATERWAEQRERHLVEEARPKRPKAPLFSEFVETCLRRHDTARRHKPSTIAMKRVVIARHLLPALGGKRLDEITAADIADLRARLVEIGRAPKTVNNVLSMLGTILGRAVDWGAIERAPKVELIRAEKREMPFLTVEHYDRLVEGARAVGPKALVLVLLAGDAGLRRGEIIALDWSKVDLARRVVMVSESETMGVVTSTKSRRWRVVPITQALHDALSGLGHRAGRVIKGRSKRGGVSPQVVRELVTDSEAAAGLPKTGRLHILRHTYASHLAQAGESLYQLQQALGHRDASTTQGYAHLTVDSLRPLAAAIDSRRRALPAKRELGDIQETDADGTVSG